MSVNKVILLGRVGNDPEVKFMPSGNAVVNLSIATNRKFKNQDSGSYEDKTEWHRVVFLTNQLKQLVNMLKKDSSYTLRADYKQGNGKTKTELKSILLTLSQIILPLLAASPTHQMLLLQRVKITTIFQIKISLRMKTYLFNR